MAFHFRFATLLELRRRQRDEAGAALGQAHEAIRRIDEQVELIRLERLDLRSNGGPSRTGLLSVDRLLVQGRYDLQLEARIESLKRTREELNQEVQRRLSALVTAETEVKRFEKLEQRDRALDQQERLRYEQAAIEDAISCRSILERQSRRP